MHGLRVPPPETDCPDNTTYLDTSDASNQCESQQHRRASERICSTCKASSTQQSIHCIRKASRPPLSPAPPPYYSITPPVRPSRNASVPVLHVETSHVGYHPQRPRPALRSHTDARPNVRFRHSSPLSPRTSVCSNGHGWAGHSNDVFIPNTPEYDTQYTSRDRLSLGIPEIPIKFDPSPMRSPHSEKLAAAEKGTSSIKSNNIVQRMEEKLWKYSASSNVIKRWLLEIISWCVSAACMAAIVIILYVLRDKPTPKWGLGLTLNTYISILSKIASAALLLPASEALGQLKWSWFQRGSKKMWDFEIFDSASRGPWGAFLLLVRTKCSNLAALGAMITILALALDPFFQQVVHNPEPWLKQETQSTIARVVNFESPFKQEFRVDGSKEGERGGEITFDRDLLSTADKYFFNFDIPEDDYGNGTHAEIPLSCPTSNCTWEPYETLGVCSECTDVAHELEFACDYGILDWVQSANSYDDRDNGTMCGWFFNATDPDRLLMMGYLVDNATNQTTGEILTSRALPLIRSMSRRPYWGDGSLNFKHIRHRLNDFVVVSAMNGSDPKGVLESIHRRERPRAIECVLAWCVKTVQSSYFLAGYTETINSVFMNTTAEPYPWLSEPLDNNGTTLKIYTQNVSISPSEPDNYENATIFGVSNSTAFRVINIFDDYLPSMMTAKTKDSKTYQKYRLWEQDPYIREYTHDPWSAPNNITHHMERLATTMTNVMRSSSKDFVVGSSFSQEPIVEVHWWWLTLPISLLFFTFVFLVATVIRTDMEKDRVGVWKTSAIATLMHGLPDNLQQRLAEAKSGANGTSGTKAKDLRVRMLPTKRWRISDHMFSPAMPKKEKVRENAPPGWI